MQILKYPIIRSLILTKTLSLHSYSKEILQCTVEVAYPQTMAFEVKDYFKDFTKCHCLL